MSPSTPWTVSRRRALLADCVGLAAILLLLLDYLNPSLLFLPTITAGGDTPCHYPTAVWLHEQLLPRLRLHGWYPGAYLGQPLLLYYFPLPFLLMSALAPLTGMPVAFKLGTAIGILLLPIWTYVSFRLMGFRFPAPLLGAVSAFVFLLVEDNPIWGGTIVSTLAGEFSYTYGIGFGVLFLGVVYRAYAQGRRPWGTAAVLAVTALAHGYAVLWAGLSASYFLYSARRPGRTLRWLVAVGLVAFALAGITLLPLLADWKWTTPYDDPWITVALANLVPRILRPWLVLAALGLGGTLLLAPRLGGADHRLLFLLHAGLVGAALAAAGPALGVIDVRFVPFAQLSVCLAGGAALGLAVSWLAAADLVALSLVVAAALYADSRSTLVRGWIEWNYTGLEAKELWPAFREVAARLEGSVADPRVAVEYNALHDKAGSIRMYETLPFFTGRSTLEGVYNQASLQTHFVYYLASELGETSPNPFRSRNYSTFDTDNALRHLRLFNVSDVVAVSPKLTAALEVRSDVEGRGRVAPYALFRIAGSGAYVEPLSFAPVRAPIKGWRDRAYRWFSQKPLSPVHLVFTDDPQFTLVDADPWLPPPQVPLDPGVRVRETVEAERITIETSRVGHPLLVKVSYHPRWRAEGADGPFLVSPALMMVVPREPTVHLIYGRTAADAIGAGLTLGALGFVLVRSLRRGVAAPPVRSAPAFDACAHPPSPRRWGGFVPIAVLSLLAAGRLVGPLTVPSPSPAAELYENASRAYAGERYAEAAEYANAALAAGVPRELRGDLLCVRGESLLRSGRPREAAEAFQEVVRDLAGSPHEAQALFGAVQALEAAGDAAAAAPLRKRLADGFAGTPWAARLAGRQP